MEGQSSIQDGKHHYLVEAGLLVRTCHMSHPTSLALAQELVTVIRERKATIRVLGMDEWSVNTGIHNAAIRLVEVMLANALHLWSLSQRRILMCRSMG
jgi:hypothetical protein